MKNLPSSKITKVIRSLSIKGINAMDLSVKELARISNVKIKDIQLQISEINNASVLYN